MTYKLHVKQIICMALVCTIVACGGGSNTPAVTPTPTPIPVPSLSGTFTDAPVVAISYSTSGGYSSTTDSQGHFKYNAGDTVTFKVGNLTLGSTTGGNMIGPADLSNDPNKVSNMFILLQSLDTGTAPSVLTLPTGIATINLSALDLTLPTATFGSSTNTPLIAVQAAAGLSKPIVSAQAAQAHVTAQFRQQATGIWQIYKNGIASPSLFRFTASGDYLMGEDDGMERGTLSIDPLTARASAIIKQDTNGQSGFSNPSAADLLNTVKIDGADIIARTPAAVELFRFKRITNDATGIVGAWTVGTNDNLIAQHFVFLADGHLMMIDPLGDTNPSHPPCGGPGVEYGTYTYDKSHASLTITSISVDTNGCAGFNEPSLGRLFQGATTASATLSADGNTLTLAGTVVLSRVSQ